MIIFDLDGTLYRTHETVLPPLYDICREYGLTLTKEDESLLLYTTADTLLDRIAPDMPPELRNKFCYDLKWRERELVKEKGRLFCGVEDLLKSLASNGIPMAICGMGSKEYIETVLDRCNIKHYFKYICHRVEGLTKSQVLKKLLENAGLQPNECIMVGDSATDIKAAKDNSIAFIGVKYGYGANDIKEANALVDDVSQLKSAIYKFMAYSCIESKVSGRKRPVIVGINGVDTSGKTGFSIGLPDYLASRGYSTELIHMDDFHNPSSIRSKDSSPQGYINNAFNLSALAELIREIRSNPVDKQLDLLNLDTDTYENKRHYKTDDDTIVIVEGTLLYRPPIDSLIDYKVFLNISFEEVMRRAAVRDVPKYGEQFLQKYHNRYIPAQEIYLSRFNVKSNCHMIVDNSNYDMPIIVKDSIKYCLS